MKENKYDDSTFFEKYSQMDRSTKGLVGAGEWHELKKLLPNFTGKSVLDLGCGFGWHCQYAYEQGATKITGIDISEKMLAKAKELTASSIEYQKLPLEEISFPPESYDIVISSLTLHYIESFEDICSKVFHILSPGGSFVFSVEHPIFTAEGSEEWIMTEGGEISHWPVDNYFYEGLRESIFLGEKVRKYHKTLTTYLNTLLNHGFSVEQIVEPMPSAEMQKNIPSVKEELRRPMMLLVSAKKR